MGDAGVARTARIRFGQQRTHLDCGLALPYFARIPLAFFVSQDDYFVIAQHSRQRKPMFPLPDSPVCTGHKADTTGIRAGRQRLDLWQDRLCVPCELAIIFRPCPFALLSKFDLVAVEREILVQHNPVKMGSGDYVGAVKEGNPVEGIGVAFINDRIGANGTQARCGLHDANVIAQARGTAMHEIDRGHVPNLWAARNPAVIVSACVPPPPPSPQYRVKVEPAGK